MAEVFRKKVSAFSLKFMPWYAFHGATAVLTVTGLDKLAPDYAVVMLPRFPDDPGNVPGLLGVPGAAGPYSSLIDGGRLPSRQRPQLFLAAMMLLIQ